MKNLSVTLFCTLLIVFCASIFAQFDVPGGFEMAMKEGYNQYTLSDDQRRNIGQQIMGMRNENRGNSLSGDQTSQYAQIMSRMGEEQQTLQNVEDQEGHYADIQSQGMNNKPQDQYVDGNAGQNGVTEAIDPLTMNEAQPGQYGVTEAIDPRSLPQSNVEQQDQTSNYAFIEQEKYAKQQRIARKNEERSRNEVPVAVQAIDPQEILAFQQSGEKQEQLTSGFDQTEYFSNVMRGKAAMQDQLANEQPVTSGLGVFEAIDPQNLSQQQQQQPSVAGIKSWSSLNAKSFYVPQSTGRKQSSSSYDFQSLNSANNADQTSDYLRIMAQQRRIQQELQS